MAFRILAPPGEIPTLKIPTPRIWFQTIQQEPLVRQLMIEIESSRVGYDYTLLSSQNFDSPVEDWQEIWTEPGHGGAVDWAIGGLGAPYSRYFFSVRAHPGEP